MWHSATRQPRYETPEEAPSSEKAGMAIESLLTQKEEQRALTLSQTIEADLKPQPPTVALQGPGL